MGMNVEGDELIPIPQDVLDRLKGDDVSERMDNLRRMMQQSELDGTSTDDDPKLPIWSVGEKVALRGIEFEIVKIVTGDEPHLCLKPCGRIKDVLVGINDHPVR